MSRPHVLVIDDDPDIRQLLSGFLTEHEYHVLEAEDVATGMKIVEAESPDIVLVDVNLPDGTGFELVRNVRAGGFPSCIIVITGDGSIELAVKALQDGADNFVTKPLDLGVILAFMEKAQESLMLKRQLLLRAEADSAIDKLRRSKSPVMLRLLDSLSVIAESSGSVLINGESGTGKSLLARAIHELSPRASKPFVELNCSSLSRELLESELFGHSVGAFTGATKAKPGLVEVADTGTFFLDEIGDMDLAVQPKLLKLIEDHQVRRLGSVHTHEVDVRIMAATHFDLDDLIGDGQFRKDLYYRLNVLNIVLPSLRDRREDIADLAMAFLEKRGGVAASVRGFSSEALDWLRAHDWPGNIRELRNLVERAAVYAAGGLIKPEHFGVSLTPTAQPVAPVEASAEPAVTEPKDLSLAALERRHIHEVLDSVDGNKTRAAKILGITRQTLLRKIRA